jgi:hypothetical protein
MPTYLSDVDILAYLTVVLMKNTNASELPPGTSDGVTVANARGYGDILTIMQERGFLKSQIDLWDRAVEFNRDLAIYWLMIDQVNTETGDVWPLKYDRRKELKTVSFTVAGALQNVQNGQQRVGFGPIRNCGDIFSLNTRW